jgi:hypothetical protein
MRQFFLPKEQQQKASTQVQRHQHNYKEKHLLDTARKPNRYQNTTK